MSNNGNNYFPGADDWSNPNIHSSKSNQYSREEIRSDSEDYIENGGMISQYDVNGEFIGYSVQI